MEEQEGKIWEIRAEVCDQCGCGVPGHAVIINGTMYCLFCELDMAMQKIPEGANFKLVMKTFENVSTKTEEN